MKTPWANMLVERVWSQAVCFRFVRFYLLLLMLLQIPIVMLGRYYAHNRCLANAIFWASLLFGKHLTHLLSLT